MKKTIVLVLCLVLIVALAGCGGSGSKWKPYLGKWTNETMATRQMEIKANGDNFIMTYYQNNFIGPEIKTTDYILKPSGEVLAVTAMGIEMPMIHDPKADTLSFDGQKWRRQTAEDAKKMEELKKSK